MACNPSISAGYGNDNGLYPLSIEKSIKILSIYEITIFFSRQSGGNLVDCTKKCAVCTEFCALCWNYLYLFVIIQPGRDIVLFADICRKRLPFNDLGGFSSKNAP
jgi:hypothetical protein